MPVASERVDSVNPRLTLRGYLYLGSHEKHFPYFKMSIIMTLLKHKCDVNLSFHSTNQFPGLTQGAFSVSKGHFLTSRQAFPGFEKGVAHSHRHSASVT